MEKNFQVFNFDEQRVRVIFIDGESWFVAKDVCDVLELSNPTEALRGLDEDEKNSLRVSEGNKGNPNMSIISESGLYNLIFRSNKPEAKKFRKWVTSEVLPSIRKIGKFSLSKIPVPPMIEKLEEMLREVKKEARRDAIPWEMAMQLQSVIIEQIVAWAEVERSKSLLLIRARAGEASEDIGIICKVLS